IEFLWVWWFEYDGTRLVQWRGRRLDSLRFPPLATQGAFRFVDPRDMLRGCHIIPAFTKGKHHLDGVNISSCAHDGKDWTCYHINQFADRDMLMQYHWGLGVGHVYSH
ncbi:hypothetical protein PILCRDRAFT_55766, partial [Piloderma croceum F 1598]